MKPSKNHRFTDSVICVLLCSFLMLGLHASAAAGTMPDNSDKWMNQNMNEKEETDKEMEDHTDTLDLPIPHYLQSNLIADQEESSEYELKANFFCDKCHGEVFQIFYRICSMRNYLVAKCSGCQKEIVIYDANKHGYNGFVCKDNEEDDTPLEKYSCVECGIDSFKVTVYIESSGKDVFEEDVLEYEEQGEFTMDDWVDAFDSICVGLECIDGHIEDYSIAFECA